MSFDIIDLFCYFCRYTSHVDVDAIKKNGAYCQNCGKCLHEKDNEESLKDPMTEQERISEVIWKNRKK
jgi:transcription initiation factor IIE alpha subunit